MPCLHSFTDIDILVYITLLKAILGVAIFQYWCVDYFERAIKCIVERLRVLVCWPAVLKIKINKCYTCREHTCSESMHKPKEADFCELVSSGGDSYFQVKRVRGHSRYLSARSSTQSDIMLANTVTSELAPCLQCSRRTQRHGHGLQRGFHTHTHTHTYTHRHTETCLVKLH